jgi:hypothetical protein
MNASKENSEERRLQQVHEQTIESLSKELQIDSDRVRILYVEEHERIASRAKIKTYVPVIAARLVRSALHSMSRSRVQ